MYFYYVNYISKKLLGIISLISLEANGGIYLD